MDAEGPGAPGPAARRPAPASARGRIVNGVGILLGLFHLYASAFGTFEVLIQRGVHLAGMLAMAFLLYPGRAASPRGRLAPGDMVLAALALVPFAYIFARYEHVTTRIGFFTPVTSVELIVAGLLIVLVLEAARRTTGWTLPALVTASLVYALTGPLWPGVLRHAGSSLSELVDHLVLQPEGVFGPTLGVSATYLATFLVLSAFLARTGMARLFIRASILLAGRRPGGPAKIAIVGSSLMGMISGQPVANVLTIGSFTIPAMIRAGYRREFAAAVEAVASTGGQLMPPVMGAAAFVMSDYTGIPYSRIAWHALLPACLFYFAVYVMVHLEARRRGLPPLAASDLPTWPEVLRDSHCVAPAIVLVGLLLLGYTALHAAFYATLASVAAGWLGRDTRLGPRRFLDVLEEGIKAASPVAVLCAAAGILVGVVDLTGVGPRLGGVVVALADGQPVLALALTAAVCVVLGTGLPTTASYIAPAAIMAPALVSMGLPLLGVHLFIFYYAVVSAITPPVALAADAAAAIAGSEPSRTAWIAVALGVGAYLVPFMFVLDPALVLDAPPLRIIAAIAWAVCGLFALCVSIQGHWLAPLGWAPRALLLIGAILLVRPGALSGAAGLLCIGAPVAWQLRQAERSR